MTEEKTGHFILGITQKGNKFRPSDWVERIAAVFGSFDASQRLRYHPMLRPARYEGLHCLYVDGKLAVSDPAAYRFVMEFAFSNHLQIKHIGQVESQQSPIDLPDVA
jgi:hypothetical protein